MLKYNYSIKTLFLCNYYFSQIALGSNELGINGTKAIAEALAFNKVLKELSLCFK